MFYGWKLATIGSCGNLLLQGSVFYTMNAFIEPLVELHGWSRAGIGLSMTFASAMMTLSMPIGIMLTNKMSIRLLMTLGAFIGGLSYVGLGYVDDIRLFAALFAIVWVCGQICGGVVATMLMNRWFAAYRGRAFGLVNMGTSLSGAFLPFVALVLVDTLGVSWAFSILGGLAFLLFPLCWRIIRNTPEDIGLTVDGVAANPFAAAREEEKVIPMNWRELVASRQMWIIGVSFGIGLMAVGGVLSQLKPRFVDTGMSSYVAMGFMCLTALLGAVGKYAWGWVCDRTTPLFATKLLFLCNALSLACIFLPHTLFNVILFVVGYGVCMGGIWTVFPSVVAYLYGKKQFPHVYKYISLFVAVKSLGYAAVGLSHSLTGNYNMAYMGGWSSCCWRLLPRRRPSGNMRRRKETCFQLVTERGDFQMASATHVYRNGTILTMDSGGSQAQALAVRGETILAVGSDAEIMALADPHTVVTDLRGRTMLPGFIDGTATSSPLASWRPRSSIFPRPRWAA